MKAHVIYGPPGTGKSTELIRRMGQCIETGISPDRIGLVSFTKAAAQELTQRSNAFKGCSISTLHSLAFNLSRISKDQVLDKAKLREFSKVSGIEIAGINPQEVEYLSNGDAYLALYQLTKARLGTYSDFCLTDYSETDSMGTSETEDKLSVYINTYRSSNRPGNQGEFLRFCDGLDRFKNVNGYVDFNDMIVRALTKNPPYFDVLFVDEAQDLSPLQWRLIYRWSEYIPEIHVAGDDDQAIYDWGGADPQGMYKFELKFNAECTVLNQSYRIPQVVQKLAEKIISKVSNRVVKEYSATEKEGFLNQFATVQQIDIQHGQDVLILYRNHSLREEMEQRVIELGLPYIVDSGSPGLLQSYLARAIKSWSKLIHDWETLEQILLTKKEFNNLLKSLKPLARKKVEDEKIWELKFFDWRHVLNMSMQKQVYFERIFLRHGNLDIEPTIHLSTIHCAKGREADRVVLLNAMCGLSWESMLANPDSEYRIFYVAVTRAKRQLDIVLGHNPLRILA